PVKLEKGFTLVELIIALAITVLVSGASAIALKQIYGGTSHNNSRLTAVQQVANAGFWICRDAQRAEVINTSNLTGTDLVTMNWTEWDAAGNPTYYSVNYTFFNINANIGQLKRTYWNSSSGSQQNLVGLALYYNSSDADNTSKATYLNPLLTVQLTAVVDQVREIRQYTITRRPNT
ncbi:MAG: prepilin-type N-terminal cleavage/methylation domain-containing protein, partial [Dehalococcoidales bacterium]|nr:prepilin-type N-terminal cleavage/methylation domain-containing protein [Dehalococcoidales bacterium]